MPEQLSGLSLGRKLVLGGGLLLFIASLLPWWHVSAKIGNFSASASANGWHKWGPLVFLLGIVWVLFEGARVAGVVPLPEKKADTASAVLGAVTSVLGLLFALLRLFGDDTGWGTIVGLIALIGLAYATFLLFTAGGGMASVKDLQGDLQAKASEMREQRAASTAPPETPPAPVNEPIPPVGEPPAPVAQASDAAPEATATATETAEEAPAVVEPTSEAAEDASDEGDPSKPLG